jgi:hypothetical protein
MVGLCSFFVFITASGAGLYRTIRRQEDWLLFALWLGVAGLAMQEFVEFSLYIPALSWPLFLILGLLWGCSSQQASHGPGRVTSGKTNRGVAG